MNRTIKGGGMMRDLEIEVLKATPAVGGTVAVAHYTPNEIIALIVGIATFFYLCLQAAYLIWKWRREARG